MEKKKPTTKLLTKHLRGYKNIMKIPKNEGNFVCNEKENKIKTMNNHYKRHDREINFDNTINPFDLPDNMRIFSKRKPGMKKDKNEPFITKDVHTICDIDETFYKVIEGRPLRQSNDVKVYMRNIRDITLFRANTAYLKQEMVRIDTAFAFEMEEFNKINALYLKTKQNFVDFAKQSYEDAKKMQINAEKKANELVKVLEEREACSFELVRLRNLLSHEFFTFKKLIIYGKFLYKLSPIIWQEEFSIPKRDSVSSSTDSVYSINEYIKTINETRKQEPLLYFKKPEDLMHVFDEMAQQCLNYMEINVNGSKLFSSIHKCHKVMKFQTENEINEVKSIVQVYEDEIMFLEEKANSYKEAFDKILLSEFHTLYSSMDVVKLFTCIQYVNVQIFGGTEDLKDSIFTLMAQIEKLYINLTSGLDNLNQEVVKTATKYIFNEDIKKMNRAHKAQRIMRESDLLRKSMYSSFEPPRVRKFVDKKGRD